MHLTVIDTTSRILVFMHVNSQNELLVYGGKLESARDGRRSHDISGDHQWPQMQFELTTEIQGQPAGRPTDRPSRQVAWSGKHADGGQPCG